MLRVVAVRARCRTVLPLALLALAACASEPPSDSSTTQADSVADANMALVRRALTESWNDRNMAVLAEVNAPDVASYTNGVRDTLSAEQMIQATLQMYPDTRVEIVDMRADGDHVFTHWTWTATAVPSTNRATIHGASISRLVDGKLVEDHSFYDLLAFSLASGATLTPAAGAAPPTTTSQ